MRLIVLCAAALGGLAVGDVGRLEPAGLLFGGLLSAVGAAMVWQRPALRMVALVTCAAALGGLRAALVPADSATGLEPYFGQMVRLRGVVAQPPSVGPTVVQVAVEARGVGAAGGDPPPLHPTAAEARVRVVGDPATLTALVPGEALVLEGRLLAGDGQRPPTLLFPRLLAREPPPAFEAPAFDPSAAIGGLRAAADAGIHRYLPEPQASLSAGVLLGGTGRLDADFRQQLQRSGLAHVVAIDGFKQVVVAGVLGAGAVRLLGPRLAALPVLIGIAGYTLLTGAHPAAVRAGLMVALALLASRAGRVADPLTSVLVAATLMAAVEPRILLDVGLQLSLSATLGIVLLWPRLRPRFRGLPRLLAEPVGLTLAVTLATLPITLSVFQLVSLVSPVAHVLAVPLLPLVLVSAGLLALVAPIPPVAAVLSWVAWLPSTLLVAVIELFGNLPGAALATGRLPPVAAGGLAGVLLVWGIWGLPELAGLRMRLRRAGVERNLGGRLWAPAAAVATCLVAAVLLQVVRPDGRLHVQHLAAGQGEAVFIRGPTGRTALVVDGRLDAVQLAGQVADHLAVWEHRLDTVLQLDPAAQAGLGLTLARYPAERLVDPTVDGRIDLGGGAVLDVYPSAGQALPGIAMSFGHVWLPLSALPAGDVISDGTEVWAADPPAQASQASPKLQPAFAVEIR